LEPLQQEAERMIEKMQAEKGKIEKIHAECREVLEEHITTECGKSGRAEHTS
jgi:hypothetical protein